jgi:serine protease Do
MRAADAVLSLAVLGFMAPAGWAQQENRIFDFRDLHPTAGGFLGLRIRDVSKEDVSSLKLPGERGVIVREVESDGPADKAGLREGDVIVAFQGQPVESASQFQRLVHETPGGRVVTLDVLRHGTSQSLNATVGRSGLQFFNREVEGAPMPPMPPVPGVPAMPAMPPFPPMPSEGARVFEWPSGPAKLGLRFEEIGGQLAKYFKVESGEGILVVDVDPDGPAGKAGIKAGDVVSKVDGKEVGRHTFLETVRHLDAGTTVTVTVLRDGKPVDLRVTVGGGKGKMSEPTI